MSQSVRKLISENIYKYRVLKGYSREELSLMLGVDNSYISKLEKCKINITIDKLEQLARIFKIEIVELLQKSK